MGFILGLSLISFKLHVLEFGVGRKVVKEWSLFLVMKETFLLEERVPRLYVQIFTGIYIMIKSLFRASLFINYCLPLYPTTIQDV